MKDFLPKNLINLANLTKKPLYLVGGVVRNFLIDKSVSNDVDLAGTLTVEEIKGCIEQFGLNISAVYPRTGTVMFKDGVYNYEYTAFRKEEYVGGEHRPVFTQPTLDINEDALRRDFKCNAIYYDIKDGKYIDPLGGIANVKDKILDAVDKPDKVFSADGLRLLRLARFTGQLNFTPTNAVIESAKRFADNILDISVERIYAELKLILSADSKYHFSAQNGHYLALKVLDQTKVLDRIFPELTLGRGMAQRSDFHKYDVLEHSLRTVLYAPPEIRLSALLHDVGKPFCFNHYGNYYNHNAEGQTIAEGILQRLKVDKSTIRQVKFLVKEHMVDIDCAMRENKVRKFIQKNHQNIEQLLMLKQADYMACLDDSATAPTIVKWKKIYDKMKVDGTPFSLKELDINSSDLIEIGYQKEQISKELNSLLEYTAVCPDKNKKQFLMVKAESDFWDLSKNKLY